MWTKIAIGVVIVLVIVGAIIATRPDSYSVERSAVVAAPPEVVFEYVNDFHRWAQWSPFEKLDPAMQKTFEGSPSGVGAGYHWKGNSKAGEGRMRIAESERASRIAIDMRFLEPFESTSVTTFTFEPVAEGTRVTWGMAGENTTMGKAISLVASMDKMIGKDFEEGLAKLGTVAETDAKRRAQDTPAAPAEPVARAP